MQVRHHMRLKTILKLRFFFGKPGIPVYRFFTLQFLNPFWISRVALIYLLLASAT